MSWAIVSLGEEYNFVHGLIRMGSCVSQTRMQTQVQQNGPYHCSRSSLLFTVLTLFMVLTDVHGPYHCSWSYHCSRSLPLFMVLTIAHGPTIVHGPYCEHISLFIMGKCVHLLRKVSWKLIWAQGIWKDGGRGSPGLTRAPAGERAQLWEWGGHPRWASRFAQGSPWLFVLWFAHPSASCSQMTLPCGTLDHDVLRERSVH